MATAVPTNAVDLAIYRSVHNRRKVVPIGNRTEIFINKNGTLTIRKDSRSGGLNAKAKALQACKGKGITCVETVLPNPKRGKKSKSK